MNAKTAKLLRRAAKLTPTYDKTEKQLNEELKKAWATLNHKERGELR